MKLENHRQLITTLYECVTECNHCATACLDEEDVKMMVTCIKTDIDCASICSVAAALLARGSEHGHHLLAECAEVCTACADECEKHAQHGMEHCRKCAEACRKCAAACREHLAGLGK